MNNLTTKDMKVGQTLYLEDYSGYYIAEILEIYIDSIKANYTFTNKMGHVSKRIGLLYVDVTYICIEYFDGDLGL